VLETISASGHVIVLFVVWAIVSDFMAIPRCTSNLCSMPSRYIDDELGLDYITKHVDPYTAPTDTSTWRMLIVDGHSSHTAYPGVEYDLSHGIVVYCLPPHSTHLMQPLDVACFGPLSKACRTALQDFIYIRKSWQVFGKQEFCTVTISTPLKVANMRSTLSRLTMTPNSRAIMDDGLIHLEKKGYPYPSHRSCLTRAQTPSK